MGGKKRGSVGEAGERGRADMPVVPWHGSVRYASRHTRAAPATPPPFDTLRWPSAACAHRGSPGGSGRALRRGGGIPAWKSEAGSAPRQQAQPGQQSSECVIVSADWQRQRMHLQLRLHADGHFMVAPTIDARTWAEAASATRATVISRVRLIVSTVYVLRGLKIGGRWGQGCVRTLCAYASRWVDENAQRRAGGSIGGKGSSIQP